MLLTTVTECETVSIPMALEQELQFFKSKRDEWVKMYVGKFALVKGQELIGVFDTPDAALSEGVKRFQAEPFLIRQINANEPEIYIPALALGLIHAHFA